MIPYLPLGSIVLLEGGSQKLIIIARGMHVTMDEQTYFFDYGGVPYPDGLVGDRMAYFNHSNVSKVVFEGYSDVDNENIVDGINRYLSSVPQINRYQQG